MSQPLTTMIPEINLDTATTAAKESLANIKGLASAAVAMTAALVVVFADILAIAALLIGATVVVALIAKLGKAAVKAAAESVKRKVGL